MKTTKKMLILLMACVMLFGATLSVSAATPKLSTHYCPNHGKALVYHGQYSSIKCKKTGKAAIVLSYICPYYHDSSVICYYEELRCDGCGENW